MALAQSIPTLYWVDATYWTITRIAVDRQNLIADIKLAGYASQEAEKEKAQPLTYQDYQVKFVGTAEEIVETSGIPNQLITPELVSVFETLSVFGYWLTKQSSEFANSKDV